MVSSFAPFARHERIAGCAGAHQRDRRCCDCFTKRRDKQFRWKIYRTSNFYLPNSIKTEISAATALAEPPERPVRKTLINGADETESTPVDRRPLAYGSPLAAHTALESDAGGRMSALAASPLLHRLRYDCSWQPQLGA